MGLGRHGGGVGAARWLAQQGAILAITDLAPPEQLSDSLAAIADLPIQRLRLGEHIEKDFTSAEVVVVNPAVKPSHPLVELARHNGAWITTETELFLEACPAPVIGITGSNGKSTTSAMTAAILEVAGRRTWLGGNIGRSLLIDLDQMRPSDVVVLELSSFQLHYLSDEIRGPQVAVITNCAANHLDWHGTHEHYVRCKQRMLTLQGAADVAVLSLTDNEVSRWRSLVRGRLAAPWGEDELPPLRVPGVHNRTNASLAAAAAAELACAEESIRQGLADFAGLPHRLEFVAEIQGRRFYNDSKATTPEAAIAALAAFDAPVWLLAGGYAKGGNYDLLARTVATQARGVALFGQAAGMLHARLRQSPQTPSYIAEAMEDALHWAWTRSHSGDVILLSPACASFDQFRDFSERGNRFRALVQQRLTAKREIRT
jgi:UDP-N-acetylmuramoylalanine--D-glutamate ligase